MRISKAKKKMDVREYQNIFAQEETHFFYVANHALILSLVEKYVPKKRSAKRMILDAGCGTGLLAQKLLYFGEVVGVDISPHALRFAKKRGITVVKASITDLPFQDNMFDLIVSVDVLYHKAVSRDDDALKEFFRVLKPGGLLILRVPANKWLKLAHDSFVHTKKRYEKKELSMLLKKTRFNIKKLSFVNALLLPLASLAYVFEKTKSKKEISSGVKPLHSVINSMLIFTLSLENRLLSFGSLPFGLGLIAVCTKET